MCHAWRGCHRETWLFFECGEYESRPACVRVCVAALRGWCCGPRQPATSANSPVLEPCPRVVREILLSAPQETSEKLIHGERCTTKTRGVEEQDKRHSRPQQDPSTKIEVASSCVSVSLFVPIYGGLFICVVFSQPIYILRRQFYTFLSYCGGSCFVPLCFLVWHTTARFLFIAFCAQQEANAIRLSGTVRVYTYCRIIRVPGDEVRHLPC